MNSGRKHLKTGSCHPFLLQQAPCISMSLHQWKNDLPKLAPYLSMSLHKWKNDPSKLAPYILMSLHKWKNDPSQIGALYFDVTT